MNKGIERFGSGSVTGSPVTERFGGSAVRSTPNRTTNRTTPHAAGRLDNPDAFLSRTDLRDLGLERRAVDAVFRALDVVYFPGYSRPLIRVTDFLELVKDSTYDDSRVR